MNEPTEAGYRALYDNYVMLVIDLDDPEDPPNLEAAANIILKYLQDYSDQPCRFYSYQLKSIEHILGIFQSASEHGVLAFWEFVQLCQHLLSLCNQGQLPDMRIRNN